MLTKLGLTAVVLISVALFYVINQDQDEVEIFGLRINVDGIKRALLIDNRDKDAIRRVVEREKRAEERAEAERKERNREYAEKEKERKRKAEEKRRLDEERERHEAARKEKERLEAERKEQERLEAERKEQERLEAERKEQERLEAERKEQERLEAERKEKERLEAEMKEQERLETERKEKERLEAERKEQERLEAERKEQERLEAERKEQERLEAERKEQERLEAERKEQVRLETERKEQERLETERKEQERLEAERKEQERLEAERKEQERLETERKEQERLEAEKKEQERLEVERKEQERLEVERKEQERLEAERKEQERLEAERKEQERLEAKRKEQEKLGAENKKLAQKEESEATIENKEVLEAKAKRLEKETGNDPGSVTEEDVLRSLDEAQAELSMTFNPEVKVNDAEELVLDPKTNKYVKKQTNSEVNGGKESGDEEMHLAVVACGDRLEETLIMIKSALMFSRSMLHVHIFSDTDLQQDFRTKLADIPEAVKARFQPHVHDIQFPAGYKQDEWRKLFKTCATQRLFIPDILLDVRRLIYVDTDILFLRPLEDIWHFFSEFNATQIAAVSWEHEDGSAGWYNRFARHPYYPPFGVNSGVMLMDLPALRAHQWTTLMKEYYDKYKFNLTWGDQDLINIFFHYYPEKLYIFSCIYNYRPDHCMYMQNCRRANTDGISVIHGNRGTLHNEKQVMFRSVYNTFKEHKLGEHLGIEFLQQMKKNLEDPGNSKDRCHKERHIFTIQLAKTINELR